MSGLNNHHSKVDEQMTKSKQVKRKQQWYFLLVLMPVWMLIGTAYALEMSFQSELDSVSMFELLAMFLGGEAAAKWVAILGLLAWILTQFMAWLPPEWVAKLPSWLIKLVNIIAGNYRRASNGVDNDSEQIRRTF